MHDIDRTQAELGWETESYESDEYAFEDEFAMEGEADTESILSEADEMEFAAELLEVSDEAELDQFIGNLIRRVGRTVGRVVRSPLGGALGGALRGIARTALPHVSGALGSLIPIPGVGGALGSAAGQMFGLELEGMSAEDQEFEVARRFVRLASEATRQAASAPPSASPQAVAQQALSTAAQIHAPGLLNGNAGAMTPKRRRSARSGRWVRRGRTIILVGV